MDALVRDVHAAQAVVHVLEKARRAAQVEVVIIQRQSRLDLREVQAAGHLVIARWLRRAGCAQRAVDVQQPVRALLQFGEFCLEGQVGQGSGALEQMNRTRLALVPVLRHPFSGHRDQRRDADPGAEQYHWPSAVFLQVSCPAAAVSPAGRPPAACHADARRPGLAA